VRTAGPGADNDGMARRIAPLVVVVLALLALAASAGARSYAPPNGKVVLGMTGRGPTDAFAKAHGRQPAIIQTFIMFRGPIEYAFANAERAGAAPMFHISTADGPDAREVVTPKGIAQGAVDDWLVSFQRRAAQVGGPVYVRLMGEMNGHWNQYSAYGPGGRRDAAHSTAWFRKAWKRTTVILRGGPGVDARLKALHLKPLGRGDLPAAQIAMVWCPQVAGAPDVAGNAPRAYWPGGRFVDWVSTDFYSKFPNFAGLERFYHEFPGKPFSFGEWAIWDRDNPGFVRQLFAWVRTHPRTKMLVYNQGSKGGPFDLARFPQSSRTIRAETRGARYGS
jgi:hypothetical protein